MEYFIGCFSTLVILFFVGKYNNPNKFNKDPIISIKYRQSSMYELIKEILPKEIFNKKTPKTQSMNHEKKTNVKVIIVNGYAYWVKDNIFYMADMLGGLINKDTTRLVDTMGMDKVELDRMLFIMDRLRDGEGDDRSSTGN
jgi:hypothetical protein